MFNTIYSEETEETTVTAQVKKTCPNNDQYCLECSGSECKRCGASYWDPNTGMCKAPIVKIDNCKLYIIFIYLFYLLMFLYLEIPEFSIKILTLNIFFSLNVN